MVDRELNIVDRVIPRTARPIKSRYHASLRPVTEVASLRWGPGQHLDSFEFAGQHAEKPP